MSAPNAGPERAAGERDGTADAANAVRTAHRSGSDPSTGVRHVPAESPTGRLAGQNVLVTGGGSGIGRGVVDAYVAEGARVTVLERSASYVADLRRDHDDVVVVQGDVTDPGAVEQAVTTAAHRGEAAQIAAASEQLAGDDVAAVSGDDATGAVTSPPTGPPRAAPNTGRLDQLTCCAGVFDYYASVRELSTAELAKAGEEIWRVNVLGGLLAINVAYPLLKAARGSVTLTLSASAFYPEGGGVLYGSSKWALRGVVAHLAKDLAPEVRVNGVAPGGTAQTRLGGLDALGQDMTADRVAGRDERIQAGNALQVLPRPEDHVGAYVYLADPAAARIVTGVVVNTDGGRA